MRKHEALSLLEAHKQEMVRKFGVRQLAVFGSTARDEARDDSDVDVLVEFDGGEKARKLAGETMRDVREAMGLSYI